MTTPPHNNLGPLSQPWARYWTEEIQINRRAIERLSGDSANAGILDDSTLNNLASQIKELYARQTGVVTHEDVALPSFSSGRQARTITMQIPRPTDSARTGWLSVQFTATNSNNLQSEVYGSFSIDGTVFHRDSRTVPTENLEPASWNGNKAITGYSGFTISPSDGGLISITLEAEAAFSTGARIVSFSNIQANYQFGQII